MYIDVNLEEKKKGVTAITKRVSTVTKRGKMNN